MSTIDQQFVEYIVKTLVNNPDKVEVERTIDEKGVLLQLTVDPEDVGRVIGRRGATAQSLRTLLRALGTKNDAHYNLKITNDGPAPRHEDRGAAQEKPAQDSPAEETTDSVDVSAVEAPAEEDTYGGDDLDDDTSDLAEKTRAELADMDDLDI
ncbi:KH domain-containing protein [Candidatus Saccharibacteria bacterium]|nr:KH domain-containing protein [Candidatus Saccharibacteria bacterium]